MAVSLKLDFKQTQKLVMTQTLRQSIEMLQLSTVEIAERIAQELLENPAIEEMDTVSDDAGEPESRLHASVSRSLSGDESFADRHDDLMKLYGDASESGYESSGSDFDRKRQYIENAVSQKESLTDHLLWQARMWALSENDYMLLQGVITSLDSDGFLPVDAGVIAGDYGVPDERVMEIISVIQNFDPVGCAVSGMRESLLVQCRHFYPGDDLLHQMLSDKFTELEKYDYQAIASALKVKLEDVVEKGRLLHNLNPFPGRGYSRSETTYIVPDVEVKIVDGELVVTLNDDWVPRIGINAYYSRLLREKEIDKKQKEYIQEKLQSARYFLRNISSRRNTILKVVRAIMEHQMDFLISGPGNLRSLTHIDIASELGIHESTVSRVASGKFIQTGWGIFEMKYFFVSRLRSQAPEGAEDQSSDRVRRLIRDLVDGEDPMSPLSDEDIAAELRKQGTEVARRTVAKYRGLLHILPANKRKRINLIKKVEEGTV